MLEFEAQIHAKAVREGFRGQATPNDETSPTAIVGDNEDVCRVDDEVRQRTYASARRWACPLRRLDAGGDIFKLVLVVGHQVSTVDHYTAFDEWRFENRDESSRTTPQYFRRRMSNKIKKNGMMHYCSAGLPYQEG